MVEDFDSFAAACPLEGASKSGLSLTLCEAPSAGDSRDPPALQRFACPDGAVAAWTSALTSARAPEPEAMPIDDFSDYEDAAAEPSRTAQRSSLAERFAADWTTAGDTQTGGEGAAPGALPQQDEELKAEPESFAESSKGFRLAVRRWVPSSPKAVVILVHGGAGWHSGYFDLVGQGLRTAGYAAVAYDQVGYGYSEAGLH
eukprot:s1352_g5.t1